MNEPQSGSVLDVIQHHDDTEQEIAEAIASIWLPIFRSEQNLAMALDALKISHDSDSTADLCDRYLDAMRGVK